MRASPHHASSSEAPTLTRNQSLVFETLQKCDEPLSAYAILDELREHGLRAPLQIYRALDKLVALGVVHRLESLNAFVSCSAPDCEGHETTAFAICRQCHQVQEFSEPAVAESLADWARKAKFRPQKTTIELEGICRDCAK